MDMDKAVTRSSRFLALGGLAAIAFGILLLIRPDIGLVALLALFGAFALVYGSLSLAAGLDHLAHRSTDWVPYVVGGLAGIAIGAVTFLRPGITGVALLYLIAAWAIITGIFEIVAAVNSPGAASNRWWLGIAGLLSIAFGILLAFWPTSGVLTIVWLIGIYSIILGLMRVMFAVRAHNLQSRLRSALYDRGPRASSSPSGTSS